MEKVTKNRFPTTDDSDDDAGSPMKFGEGSGGHHEASAWVPFKLRQRGVEVPTLVSENPAAVELCLAILAGSLVDYPEIFVSEAVAVQIYLLRQRVPSLQTRPEWTTVFIILASLARRRLAADEPHRHDRLRQLMTRKARGSQPPGLHFALRLKANDPQCLYVGRSDTVLKKNLENTFRIFSRFSCWDYERSVLLETRVSDLFSEVKN